MDDKLDQNNGTYYSIPDYYISKFVTVGCYVMNERITELKVNRQ